MANIFYKPVSSLSPIDLQYNFLNNEPLKRNTITYRNGYTFLTYEGTKNYQDITINQGTCLILTSAVNLDTIFTTSKPINVGRIPGSFQLQTRESSIYYTAYSENTKTFRQSLTSTSNFFAIPVADNVVELFVNNQYVQVDEEYPYVVRLNKRSVDPENINRQRFNILYDNGFITIRTLTNSGNRFLAFGKDNILRATGLILADSVVNDYIFKCIPVTDLTLNPGFIPTNNWVTYFFDTESSINNNNLVVNKDFKNVPTNLLIDFSLEKAIESGEVSINIANLKTTVTPEGGPAPIDNTYQKTSTTTN